MKFRFVNSEEYAARWVDDVLEVNVSGLTEEQRSRVRECIDSTGLVPFMLITSMRRENVPLWRKLTGK